MKITLYTFLIGGLFLAPGLPAQDAPSRLGKDPNDLTIEPTPLPRVSATPTPIPTPKPSPTLPPTPAPTPSSQPTPPSTPEPKEETAAKREETSSPAKRASKTEAAPSAHTENRPKPGRTIRSSREARAVAGQLKALDKEWEASFNNPDVIAKSLADDFVGTSPAGKRMTKKDLLREAKEDQSAPPKTIAHDLDVHFHGPDIAVVTGAAKQFNRNRAGQIVEHDFRFTDTWVEHDGKWQCIASQSTLLRR
jgi:ketosteroid isomerase-like protein